MAVEFWGVGVVGCGSVFVGAELGLVVTLGRSLGTLGMSVGTLGTSAGTSGVSVVWLVELGRGLKPGGTVVVERCWSAKSRYMLPRLVMRSSCWSVGAMAVAGCGCVAALKASVPAAIAISMEDGIGIGTCDGIQAMVSVMRSALVSLAYTR